MRPDTRDKPKMTVVRMKDKARVLHQILNDAIFHKAGSKDSISKGHQFYLCHLLAEAKINLPNLVFNNFRKYVVHRDSINAIPFGVLL